MTKPKIKVEDNTTRTVDISREKEGSRYNGSLHIYRDSEGYVSMNGSENRMCIGGADNGLPVEIVKEVIKGLQAIIK